MEAAAAGALFVLYMFGVLASQGLFERLFG
jgi:hypothetical protein